MAVADVLSPPQNKRPTMAEKRELTSDLGRARQRLVSYAGLLPEDIRLDATICITELCDVAEREIEKAYWDGYKQYRLQAQIQAATKPIPSTELQSK